MDPVAEKLEGIVRFGAAPFKVDITDDLTQIKTHALALKLFGKGMSKLAYDIGFGEALILPQTREHARWRQVVDEECAWSTFIRSLAIFTVNSRPVQVSRPDTAELMPAYVCDSFEALAQRDHIFVIDLVSPETSTWKGPIVPNLDLGRWKRIFRELADECFSLAQAGVELQVDTLNIAIVTDARGVVDRVCHFLFDFSTRGAFTPLPDSSIDKEHMEFVEEGQMLARQFIAAVFDYQMKNFVGDFSEYQNLHINVVKFVEDMIEQKVPEGDRDILPGFLKDLCGKCG